MIFRSLENNWRHRSTAKLVNCCVVLQVVRWKVHVGGLCVWLELRASVPSKVQCFMYLAVPPHTPVKLRSIRARAPTKIVSSPPRRTSAATALVRDARDFHPRVRERALFLPPRFQQGL